MHVNSEEEVLVWKHDVSFNKRAIVCCILLYYNCQLKLAYALVFIFYFCSSLMKVYQVRWLDLTMLKAYHRNPKFDVEFKQWSFRATHINARTSNRSEPFSLLIFLNTNKFVLLSFFTLIETIWPLICSKSRLKSAKSPLDAAYVSQ